MRKNPKKTTLSTVRKTLGLSQKALADLAGKSQATIQSIELGRLALSENLAREIGAAVNVDPNWLKNGDPNSEPIIYIYPGKDPENLILTKAIFREYKEWSESQRCSSIGEIKARFSAILGSIDLIDRKGLKDDALLKVVNILDDLEVVYGIEIKTFKRDRDAFDVLQTMDELADGVSSINVKALILYR